VRCGGAVALPVPIQLPGQIDSASACRVGELSTRDRQTAATTRHWRCSLCNSFSATLHPHYTERCITA
jgi:hypothetical protein